MIVISSERFAEHQTPPGHPESPARADVMDAVAREWRERGGEVVAPRAATAEHILRVHEALEALAKVDPRMAQVVEMRYFAGLSDAEIASALDVGDRTVRRDWEHARLLLAEALK